MGKKGKKIKITKNLALKKIPQLIKGSNVGYELTELKNTSTSDLKTMSEVIYMYFTKRSRQKKKNSNFRNLYIRIKNELNQRQNTENCRKIRFSINDFDDDIQFDIKQTPIEEVNVPNFLNDQKNIPLPSNSNNSNTLSSTTIDEDSIKEEIERLKKQKFALLYEMYVLQKTHCLNENKKEEEEEKEKEKEIKIENEKEKEKGIENDFNNIFCSNKNLELNFDIEPNLFINSENNSVYNEKEKEEYNEEILYLKN